MLISTTLVGSARIIARRNAEISLVIESMRDKAHVYVSKPLPYLVFNDLSFLIASCRVRSSATKETLC